MSVWRAENSIIFFGSWIGASEFFPPFKMVLLIGELFSTGSRGMFLLAVRFCIVLLDHEKKQIKCQMVQNL